MHPAWRGRKNKPHVGSAPPCKAEPCLTNWDVAAHALSEKNALEQVHPRPTALPKRPWLLLGRKIQASRIKVWITVSHFPKSVNVLFNTLFWNVKAGLNALGEKVSGGVFDFKTFLFFSRFLSPPRIYTTASRANPLRSPRMTGMTWRIRSSTRTERAGCLN